MFIEDHLLISYQHMIKQVDFFDFTSTLIPIMAGFPSFIPTPVIPWKGFGANQSQFAIQGITSWKLWVGFLEETGASYMCQL